MLTLYPTAHQALKKQAKLQLILAIFTFLFKNCTVTQEMPNMKPAIFCGLMLSLSLAGCQLISPVFVNYHGVRMDVAKWINSQALLSMQQKRSLAQLSRAQQKIHSFSAKDEAARFAIAEENQTAMHCASLRLSQKKIEQLQHQIFGADREHALQNYQQQAPLLKLDEKSIQCE